MSSEQGVIVGCDRGQEWLLLWWWAHYSAHNSYPVVFFDFGMTQEAKAACEKLGRCEPLVRPQLAPRSATPRALQKKMEMRTGGTGFWQCREGWFSKPDACLRSPFEQAIWLDLDMRVQGDLEPLFCLLAFGVEIALAPEPPPVQEKDRRYGLLLPGEVSYNSGVIAFQKEAEVLRG